ncbi:hypothetical protein WOLCODRAFT_92321 [Wolfiporia cocos MD-104 SS10]|uniref:Amino acid transporter n=1 Tax=Wolfiporia cocos (strain MD-104) TaxID=742152 RepID=A0A2H3J525_WOLCO|nr:hypothetical protein WOLCODRAFT_92321 [Wolfiporia cocos MD-104 SS10]
MYKHREFKRSFLLLEVFGLVFSIFGLFLSICTRFVLTYALPNGGPVALVWGWGICSCFIFTIALAMAELGFAAPTSGGLYYYHAHLNTIGLIAGIASIDWGCVVQLMAAVSIRSNQNFSATTGQTLSRFLQLYLTVIIAFPAATPDEFINSTRYAFGGFDNFSGWPDGFAFVLSFLAPLWTISKFDSSLHISEEAPMLVQQFSINVAITFRMGTDLERIVNTPTDQPMAMILYNSLSEKGTLAVWSVVITVQSFMGTSLVRGFGLPFSGWLYRVNHHMKTPINCAWVAASVTFLLGLLTFTGLPIAMIAVAWMAFSIITLVFPTSPRPTPADMNYTMVVLCGWIVLCLIYYYLPVYGGVHWFCGSITNAGISNVPASRDKVSSVEEDLP